MTPRVLVSALAAILSLTGATRAQTFVPDKIQIEDTEGVDEQFTRNLQQLGDDRDRAIAKAIDPVGYLRNNFDGQPVQILEGLRPIGAVITVGGPDPADPNRTLREVRFDDKALMRVPGNRFQPNDHLEVVMSVAHGGVMKMLKATLSNGKPEKSAKP
jgi:hypothetical protein